MAGGSIWSVTDGVSLERREAGAWLGAARRTGRRDGSDAGVAGGEPVKEPHTMPGAVFVSYRAASAEGDGGNHRTYQILHDLRTELGSERVRHIALEDWARRPESWRTQS